MDAAAALVIVRPYRVGGAAPEVLGATLRSQIAKVTGVLCHLFNKNDNTFTNLVGITSGSHQIDLKINLP